MSQDDAPKKRRKPKPDFSSPVDLSALNNVPPNNLDAERGLIGALLLDPMLCDDIIPLVGTEDFYSDANRRIYKHLVEMRNDDSGIDLLLLINRLQSSEELEAVGGQAYLAELMESVHVTVHAEYYAKIVREKSVLRRLIHLSSGIIQNAFAPDTVTKDLLNKSAADVLDLCESQTTNQVSDMAAVIHEAVKHLDTMMKGETDGIPTGFTDLDKIINGMHPNELIILAARPAMGKTAFALNIAEHIAVDQKSAVLVVSLEMARVELAKRLICSRGRVDSGRLRKNFLSASDNERFMKACNDLSEAPMFIDDSPSRTISEIAAVARKLKRQNDLKLIVIDYLGLIEPENSSDPRQEQVAKMARRLKVLARELKLPILCLAQLNRQAEATKDNKPRLSHLRESGAIEQDADVVLFIHREDKYMDREQAESKGILGQAEIIVAKQRNGPTDDAKLAWFGEYTRFENLADKEVEEYNDFAAGQTNNDFVSYDTPDDF